MNLHTMEAFQEESVTDNSKTSFNDYLLSNIDSNKTSENVPCLYASDNNMLESEKTDIKERCIYYFKDKELPVHNNVNISNFDDIKNNPCYIDNKMSKISIDSLRGNKDFESNTTSTVDNLQHNFVKSNDEASKSEHFTSDIKDVTLNLTEIHKQIVHFSSENEILKPKDSDQGMSEAFDNFENNQNHVFNEPKLNVNSKLISNDLNIVSFENGCLQPTKMNTNVVNDSMNLIQNDINMQKPLIELESGQDHVSNKLEPIANSIQLSKDVNLDKECLKPTELETTMVFEKENLSSYRYEVDSWSEDDESSSTSSDTSSDSDFFQMVVESSSGPKIIPEIKTKGELGLDDLPPIEELSIEVPEEDMVLIGKIHAVVEKLVVVHAVKDMKPLDIDSVLFLSHDKPLGRVYDVFGPVVEPFYCIRFNTTEQISEKIIEIGANVFFAPEKNDITSYVFVDELQQEKGSDASWRHNNEPPEECLDFSDDEKEKEARRKKNIRNRNKQFSSSCDVSAKRPSLTFTSTPASPQNLRSRPRTPLFQSSRCIINIPTATTISCSSPFYHPPSPSPSPSIIGAPFSMYPSHPPPLASPSVIEVEVFNPFSRGYPPQPSPSPSTSVVATPFPNANPSHPPPSSIFAPQTYIPISNPPPSISPTIPRFTSTTAPRFTPFSNSHPPLPPPSISPTAPMFISPAAPRFISPAAPRFISPAVPRFTSPTAPRFTSPAPRFTPFFNSHPPLPPSNSYPPLPPSNSYPPLPPSNSCPPPPPSPTFSPSGFTLSSSSYPPPPPPLPPSSPTFPPSRFNSFSSQYPTHPPPSPSFTTPAFNPFSSPNSVCALPPPLSFTPHDAIQRPALPPQHIFGQATLVCSLPPPVSIPPPLNAWNISPSA